MRLLSLLFVLVASCIAHSGAEPTDNFSIEIIQDGKVVTPENDLYTLDKNTFDIVTKFSNPIKILVNAYNDDVTFKQALNGVSISELTGFETTALADYSYNKGLSLQIAENSPMHWYYKNNDDHRCNNLAVKPDRIECTRTVKNIFNADNKTTIPTSEYGSESIYLVLISYVRGKHYLDRIEHTRKLVQIRFRSQEAPSSSAHQRPKATQPEPEPKQNSSDNHAFFGFHGQFLKISSEKSEEQGIGSVTQSIGIFGGRELMMSEQTSLMFNLGGGLAFAEDREKFSEFVTYGDSNVGSSKSSSIRGLAFNMEIDFRYQIGPRISLFTGAGIEKLKLRRQVEDCYGCNSENIDLDSATYLNFGIMNRIAQDDRHFRIGYKLIKDKAYGHVINISLLQIFP